MSADQVTPADDLIEGLTEDEQRTVYLLLAVMIQPEDAEWVAFRHAYRDARRDGRPLFDALVEAGEKVLDMRSWSPAQIDAQVLAWGGSINEEIQLQPAEVVQYKAARHREWNRLDGVAAACWQGGCAR